MPAEDAIRARIKELIVERLHLEGLAPAEIEDDASFEWLGLDSVDALELVVGLEKEFGIKIRTEELRKESFSSVAALAALVGRYVGANVSHEEGGTGG